MKLFVKDTNIHDKNAVVLFPSVTISLNDYIPSTRMAIINF